MLDFNNILEICEKYDYDYILINNKNESDIDYVLDPNEFLSDSTFEKNYIGTIKTNNKFIKVFFSKNVKIDNVIFKYKTLLKERDFKLKNIKKNHIK